MWWQRNGKIWSGHVRLRARVRLAQLVCELARVLIISGQSMNIAAFVLTQDLREQSRKSCEASYRVPRMFSHELASYVNAGDSWKFSSANNSQ